MARTMASVGSQLEVPAATGAAKSEILESIYRLIGWLEQHDYKAYDVFDGLNARFVRPLTFENKLLRTVLQQGVRRFPLNLRPLLCVTKERSTKAMGYFARGFIRLHRATGDPMWADKAKLALQWLIDNQSPGYSGACWGNHFDYQSRSSYIPEDMPTIVWTSLIGHAFLDGYDHFHTDEYLQIAVSSCEHILRDLRVLPEGDGTCINYTPGSDCWVHNSNVLGGSLLARTWLHTQNNLYRDMAQRSMQYTAQHQRPDGSWYYGEKDNLHWVDNFHTAYVLDCFKQYAESTADHRFDQNLQNGYAFWKNTFFLGDGTPRYYAHKTLPLDIQCASQGIDTLTYFADLDTEALPLAQTIARWTIDNMQDESGYFYYRRYSRLLVNKTATLHWGQATMMCALAGLYERL